MKVRHTSISLLHSFARIALAGTVMFAGITMDPVSGRLISHAEAGQNLIKIKRSGPGVTKRIKLGLKKAVVVDLPSDAHDILVADPSLADAVTRTSRRIYLFGKTVGQTNIFVFGPSGEEIVAIELEIERDVAGLEAHLARFLPDSNIKVEIISDNIVLTGSVRTPQDAAQAAKLAGIFLKGGEATTRVTTASGGGDNSINAENRQVSQIVNLLKIDGEDQVTLKVTIAEVSRQVLKQLGFNTTVTGNGASRYNNPAPQWLGFPGGSSLGTIANTISGARISTDIHALERAGVLRTLAEPSLTAISGEVARFSVGGTFNIEDERTQEATIFADTEYGIKLEFLPVVLAPGRISLRIKTEVSEPTFEGQSPLPSVQKREAETSVELPSGGSMMLAGLVRDTYRQTLSGMPGASKIPVLGALFRSKEFMRNETELIIIATPYLVKPVARNQLSRPDDNFNAPSDGAGFFLGRVNRVYGQMETNLPPGRYHGAVGFIYK